MNLEQFKKELSNSKFHLDSYGFADVVDKNGKIIFKLSFNTGLKSKKLDWKFCNWCYGEEGVFNKNTCNCSHVELKKFFKLIKEKFYNHI